MDKIWETLKEWNEASGGASSLFLATGLIYIWIWISNKFKR